MLTSLLLLVSHTLTAAPVVVQAASDDPPVRVWFNSNGNYDLGDRAKVYAKAKENGYLIVLRADAVGRVRVLFPLDPQDDQRITGDKKYELKGRGDREAFVANDTSGHGIVLAAISKSPFRVDSFVQNSRWNLPALSSPEVRNDPEWGLLSLVQRMGASGDRFEFDVATYVVSEQYAREPYPYPNAAGWWGYDSWYGYGVRPGFGAWYGTRYYGPGYYGGYRRGWRRR